MLTKIEKIKGDWTEVMNDCRFTVGKPPLDKEPSVAFKKAVLMAEHSPIRDIMIKWVWEKMPHWVTVHWVRHKWEKFVRTQREDRTDIPREQRTQVEPQDMKGDANVQALIDSMRKRLCRQASPETRMYAEDLKAAIHEVQPEISNVLVPNCVYRGLCPEMQPCGYWQNFIRDMSKEEIVNWGYRYVAYNGKFWTECARKEMARRLEKED